MPDYRRNSIASVCYFFTVNLLERYRNQLLIQQSVILRDLVRRDRVHYPFDIDGWWCYLIICIEYPENGGVGDIDIRVGEPG